MMKRQVCLWSVLIVIIGIFLHKGFKFQSSVCNSCHDISVMSFGTNIIAVLNFYGVDYCCVVIDISEN